MKQSGQTIDGNKVVSGVFAIYGTHGTPLEIILSHFKQNNMVIDWVDYIKQALKDGHNPETIKSRILSAAGDVYGNKYLNGFKERLDVII